MMDDEDENSLVLALTLETFPTNAKEADTFTHNIVATMQMALLDLTVTILLARQLVKFRATYSKLASSRSLLT
jgi:uncharacterized membrane protein affecting hemolysin expression